MKKKIFKNGLFSLVAILLTLGICMNVKAATSQQLVKSYTYDENTFTGATSNYKNYTYVTTPVTARLDHQDTRHIETGWNYKRMKVTRYYIDHGVIY